MTRQHLSFSASLHSVDCSTHNIARWWVWWAAVVCLLWASYGSDAQAAKRENASSSTSTSSPKKPQVHVRTRTQRSSSEETQRERDQRLRRECRGRPDAGACLGYARR